MIYYEFDKDELEKIEKALEGMGKKAPQVMARALNETAKQLRTNLHNSATETYTIKKSGTNKTLRIKNATKSRLISKLHTEGKKPGLYKFKIKKNTESEAAKAKVKHISSMKKLEIDGGKYKAFVAKMKNDHVGLFERVPGKTMKSNKKRQKISELKGLAYPQMIGNEKQMWRFMARPEMESLIHKNIQEQIEKVLGGTK